MHFDLDPVATAFALGMAVTALFLWFVRGPTDDPRILITPPIPKPRSKRKAKHRKPKQDQHREVQHAAVTEAEVLLRLLRQRAPLVSDQEGFPRAPVERPHSAAISIPKSPKPAPGRRLSTIDPNTRFFRKGLFQTDTQGRMLSADVTTEYITATPLEEMQVSGTGWCAKLHADDFLGVMSQWLSCTTAGLVLVTKLRFRHPYMTLWACMVMSPMHDDAGRYTGMQGHIWQVDEQTYDLARCL